MSDIVRCPYAWHDVKIEHTKRIRPRKPNAPWSFICEHCLQYRNDPKLNHVVTHEEYAEIAKQLRENKLARQREAAKRKRERMKKEGA